MDERSLFCPVFGNPQASIGQPVVTGSLTGSYPLAEYRCFEMLRLDFCLQSIYVLHLKVPYFIEGCS